MPVDSNLECRSETCCTRLAENTVRKKVAKNRPSHKFVGQYLRIDRSGSLRHPGLHISTGFGSCMAALMHGIGRQPNFAALNRGCHLCSAGRPSRWATDGGVEVVGGIGPDQVYRENRCPYYSSYPYNVALTILKFLAYANHQSSSQLLSLRPSAVQYSMCICLQSCR